jgi:uncharacterized RDD family membrane protein YckC
MENQEDQSKQYSQAGNPVLSGKDDLWKYQTGWRRFFAGILDSVFISIIATPLALAYRFLSSSESGPDADFIVGTVYMVCLTAVYGKTPGKHFCKVKVVAYPDEGKIGFREAVMREIVPFIMVVFILPMDYFWNQTRGPNPLGLAWAAMIMMSGIGWTILEVATYLLDPKRRAFHDKIAGTVVVKTGEFGFVESLRQENGIGGGSGETEKI